MALARDLSAPIDDAGLRLPDIDGWRLLRMLRPDWPRPPAGAVISTDDEAEHARQLGAVDVLAKPVASRETLEASLGSLAGIVERRARHVLVAADEDTQAALLAAFEQDADTRITCIATPKEAATLVGQSAFDCVLVQRGRGDDEGVAERASAARIRRCRGCGTRRRGAHGGAGAGPRIACITLD